MDSSVDMTQPLHDSEQPTDRSPADRHPHQHTAFGAPWACGGFCLRRYRKHGSGRRGPTLMRRLPNASPSRCEVRGSLAGQHQARLASDATAGDIEGGAVVNRDADHREADGNVDAVLAVHRLERRVALVVVAGDDHVPLPSNGGRYQRVGWNGAVSVNSSLTRPCDRWLENVGVLVTEDTIFACMGVETADPDRFVRLAQRTHERADQVEDVVGSFRGAVLDSFLERHMSGEVKDV